MLPEIAAKRLQALRAKQTSQSIDGFGLLELVPALNEERIRPYWFGPLVPLFERAIEVGGVRAVIAAPPQSGKTELLETALCWVAKRWPRRRHAYVTYSAERAEYVSGCFQRLAGIAGLDPKGRLSQVSLAGGTEIRFTSIGGAFTGFTVDGLLIVDDAYSNRVDAESPSVRREVSEWFKGVALVRRHVKTSIFVNGTRWHPEDLSGDRIGAGWPYYNLKALAEGPTGTDGRVESDPLRRFPGEALAPEVKPAEFYAEDRADDYNWASLFQGEPRGRGQSVFAWPDVRDENLWFAEQPALDDLRICIGCDFAYTAKTYADYSVAVVLGQRRAEYFVLDVVRAQEEPRLFRDRIKALKVKYPKATAAAYVAATEQGGVEFIRDAGLQIKALSAAKAGDKFTRALDVAARWNTGAVKLPTSAPWRDAFLNEVCGFTGVKDKHDDQVDALASAFDGLAAPRILDLSVGAVSGAERYAR